MAFIGEGSGDLHQEGGFADTRIAAKKDDRAGNKAAAGDTVKLAHAARDARGTIHGADEAFKPKDAAFAAVFCDGSAAGKGGACCLLDNGAPFAAGVATALPAGIDGAAGLTGKFKRALGHGRISFQQEYGDEHVYQDG